MLRKSIVHARHPRARAAPERKQEEAKVLNPCKHCAKELPMNDFPCACCEGRVCTRAGDCNKLFPRDPSSKAERHGKRHPFNGKPWICSRVGCERRILCPGVEDFDEAVRSCRASPECWDSHCGACVEDGCTCSRCGAFACTDCASVSFLLNNKCDRCMQKEIEQRLEKQLVLALANQ